MSQVGTPRPGDLAIQVDEVSKQYRIYDRPQDRLKQLLWGGRRRYGREYWALQDVSFNLKRGEALAVIGRNGSGKSTLLQIIAGTVTPTRGSVRTAGRVAALLELGSGFNPELTGRQNVFLSAAILGLSRSETEEHFDQIASFADIGEFINHPVKIYSTGMFVRLAFAIQTVLRPEILILDEALSVGDFSFQKKALRYLEEYLTGGGTLLLTTHDMSLIQKLCPRAILLHNGSVMLDDSASLVAHHYVTRFAHQPAHFSSQAYAVLPLAEARATSVQEFLNHAITRPAGSDFLSKDVEILGVKIEDAAGTPCLHFRPNQTMTVRTLFRARVQKPHVANGLLLADSSGTLVWGGSAVNQRQVLHVEKGKYYVSSIEVTLNLGPGRYFLTAGLSTASLGNNARTGEFHDRFVDLAEIQVMEFELGDDDPVPFWGLTGLPFKALSLEELDSSAELDVTVQQGS